MAPLRVAAQPVTARTLRTPKCCDGTLLSFVFRRPAASCIRRQGYLYLSIYRSYLYTSYTHTRQFVHLVTMATNSKKPHQCIHTAAGKQRSIRALFDDKGGAPTQAAKQKARQTPPSNKQGPHGANHLKKRRNSPCICCIYWKHDVL